MFSKFSFDSIFRKIAEQKLLSEFDTALAARVTRCITHVLWLSQDWSNFEARYASSGRPPYAPGNMTGLILYGIMEGINSLRGPEQLARLNLGCMWVRGGKYPTK